jgi:hypothetical protein
VWVAHSFSVVFLPRVPRKHDRALLVFLAAVIPEPGKSVRDQFGEDAAMFSREWIEAGSRWFDVSQRESLAREFLFHDCDRATLPWAQSTPATVPTSPGPTRWRSCSSSSHRGELADPCDRL